ncbi:MAG TPA: hypothetical protein VN063_04490 [Methylophilaceae bacterium]|nr:hypothetical protein [Methylophilaceae bacterium]
MKLKRHLGWLWALTLWFALLQAMAPFIHGHLDIDHAGQMHGIHFSEDEHDHDFSSHAGHYLNDSSHLTHTVVVATGIKKDQDAALLVPAAMLLLLLVLAPQVVPVLPLPRLQRVPRPLLQRRPSAPRAPPAL